MKKETIINLIKYHSEENEPAFRNEVINVAKYFDSIGDIELSEYVLSFLSKAHIWSPQKIEFENKFLELVETKDVEESIKLPDVIINDLKGLINAINHNINKFLFVGEPGTGKTESAKYIAKILNKHLLIVRFSELVDSKLGETNKNIVQLFEQINKIPNSWDYIILFDEIDVIALDRINQNDIREMGRATSTILNGFDKLINENNQAIIIATTNLYSKLDKALLRRFDEIINFDRYKKEDLIEIAEYFYNLYIKKFKNFSKDIKLFKKILNINDNLPSPSVLKNIIKSSLGFSNPDSETEYFQRLYEKINGEMDKNNFEKLHKQGFSLREIEKLTNKSKSSVARELVINETISK